MDFRAVVRARPGQRILAAFFLTMITAMRPFLIHRPPPPEATGEVPAFAVVTQDGDAFTREQLLGTRDLSPLDRSIDVRISRLRKRLETDAQNPRLIKTVYGAGYMLSAPVEWS